MTTPADDLHEALRRARTPAEHTTPLERFYEAADRNSQAYIEARKPDLACSAGCAFCCYQRVNGSAHEVFLIADYILSHSTPAELTEVRERLDAYAYARHELTDEQRDLRSIVCPLLVNSLCSVYPVRPLVCRAYCSADRSVCEKIHADPSARANAGHPVPVSFFQLWDAMGGQAHRCYETLGYDMTEFDMALALRVALTKPHLAKRWRQKKRALLGDDS